MVLGRPRVGSTPRRAENQPEKQISADLECISGEGVKNLKKTRHDGDNETDKYKVMWKWLYKELESEAYGSFLWGINEAYMGSLKAMKISSKMSSKMDGFGSGLGGGPHVGSTPRGRKNPSKSV